MWQFTMLLNALRGNKHLLFSKISLYTGVNSSSGPINSDKLHQFSDALGTSTGLKELSIARAKNTPLIEDAELVYFLDAVATHGSVETLDLENQQLGEQGFIALARLIKNSKTLQQIKLVGVRYARSESQITKALQNNYYLLELLPHISGEIGGLLQRNQAMRAFLKALEENDPSVTEHYEKIREDIHHLDKKMLGRIIVGLKHNEYLTEINLSGCDINRGRADLLRASLRENYTLQDLGLDEKISFGEPTKEIRTAIGRNIQIKQQVEQVAANLVPKADFHGHTIKTKFLSDLANAIATPKQLLGSLNLNHCKLNNRHAELLAEAISHNTSIKAFYLAGNGFSGEPYRKLLKIIVSKDPKTLDLSNIKIPENDLNILTNLLSTSNRLQELKLAGVTLTLGMTCMLANALKANKSLRLLDLSACNITPEGAKFLSDALLKHPHLRILKLRGNSLSTKGMRHISDLIANRPSLSTVDVSLNMACNKGAAHLAAAMKKNPSLSRLNLTLNHTTEEIAPSFEKAIAGSLNITHLDLGNKGEGWKVQPIRKTLARNKEIKEAYELGPLYDGNLPLVDEINKMHGYFIQRGLETKRYLTFFRGYSKKDFHKRLESWESIIERLHVYSQGNINKKELLQHIKSEGHKFSKGHRHQYTDQLHGLYRLLSTRDATYENLRYYSEEFLKSGKMLANFRDALKTSDKQENLSETAISFAGDEENLKKIIRLNT